jgi:hypothetical protein
MDPNFKFKWIYISCFSQYNLLQHHMILKLFNISCTWTYKYSQLCPSVVKSTPIWSLEWPSICMVTNTQFLLLSLIIYVRAVFKAFLTHPSSSETTGLIGLLQQQCYTVGLYIRMMYHSNSNAVILVWFRL